MPDSALKPYKKLAERCSDADPDKRPDTDELKLVLKTLSQ